MTSFSVNFSCSTGFFDNFIDNRTAEIEFVWHSASNVRSQSVSYIYLSACFPKTLFLDSSGYKCKQSTWTPDIKKVLSTLFLNARPFLVAKNGTLFSSRYLVC